MTTAVYQDGTLFNFWRRLFRLKVDPILLVKVVALLFFAHFQKSSLHFFDLEVFMITTTLFDRFLGFFLNHGHLFYFSAPFQRSIPLFFNFRRELFLLFLIVPFKDQNQTKKEIYTLPLLKPPSNTPTHLNSITII